MSENKNVGMPATEEGNLRKFMEAGLHLVKILEMTTLVDANKAPKLDTNGNPGIKITFQNKAGEVAEAGYYYSPLALNDPRRKEEKYLCKSEFRLHAVKKALGLGNKAADVSEVQKVKLWLVIRLEETFDTDGNPVMNDKGKPKKFHTVGDVYPYDNADPGKGRPVLKGDPKTDNENFLVGVFYERKTGTQGTSVRPAPLTAEEAGGAMVSAEDISGADAVKEDW